MRVNKARNVFFDHSASRSRRMAERYFVRAVNQYTCVKNVERFSSRDEQRYVACLNAAANAIKRALGERAEAHGLRGQRFDN